MSLDGGSVLDGSGYVAISKESNRFRGKFMGFFLPRSWKGKIYSLRWEKFGGNVYKEYKGPLTFPSIFATLEKIMVKPDDGSVTRAVR